MPKPFSFGTIEIDVSAGEERSSGPPEPDTPFRILILGDFSGRANRGIFEPGLRGRRPVPVDRDNFDEALARLAPELVLPSTGDRPPLIRVRFGELDDFHPDRIFERVPLFQALRETRRKLSDRATFAAAAAALREPAPPPPPPGPKISLHDLFEQTVEATETRATEQTARAIDDLSALVRELVRPHLVPGADPRQAEVIAQLDEAIGVEMRACLHDPAFQALEAAWRGVFFLIRRLETGNDLKLYLLDVSKAELAADLAQADDLRASGIFRIAVEQTIGTPGGQPWAVIAGDFTIDDTLEDVGLLGRTAKVARAAGAPFLAAGSAHFLGCDSLAETPEPARWRREADTGARDAWHTLRHAPEARWAGLALPRFLLRLPYGRETDPIEQFAFEEFPGAPVHEQYLWGNPAFACLCLLGEAFSQSGWGLRPGSVLEIDSLPAHVYRDDGESHLKPCAETLLTHEAAELILEAGLMPLLSLKGRDTVRLARFQSIAKPLAPLAGRWQ